MKFRGYNCEEVVDWFNASLESIHNGIIAVNISEEIIFFNKSSEKMLDLKKEEVLGKQISEVIPESKLPQILNEAKEETGKKLRINGRDIYSNRAPIIHDDQMIGAIAIFQDLTEIKNMETELQEAKDDLNLLDTILNDAYEAIVIVDKEGRITKFNEAYEEFLGVKEEDVLGKHVTEVIENTRMHIVCKTGEKEMGRVQHIEGNDMICNRIPFEKNGEVVGGIGKVLFKDVKELKHLARRLEVLEDRLRHYKKEVKRLQEAKYSFENIITKNAKMKHLKKIARKAADSNSTVLIQGESGTGKELFAHAIHKASYRKYGSFVRVNCAAIPKDLLESELFGYEEGAFTGAKKEGKPGKFEMADGGTIFLDEISLLPQEMQAKLLRVLQEQEYERIGGTETKELDCRVIAASNDNLEQRIKDGKFRKDLYYRLNVIRIEIPPLRDRKDDISLLTESILTELAKELDIKRKDISKSALNILQSYDWPGNVRELKNILERAINISSSDEILTEHLPDVIYQEVEIPSDKEPDMFDLKSKIADLEKETIKRALEYTDGNKSKSAEILGIHRTSLYNKLERYNIIDEKEELV